MATPKKSGAKKGGSRVSGTKKAGITFPVGRIGKVLRKGKYTPRTSASAAVFMAAALEYLSSETLELAAKMLNTKKDQKKRISPRAICLAVRNDEDLGALLQNVTISRGGVQVQKQEKKAKKAKKSKKGGKKGGAKKSGAKKSAKKGGKKSKKATKSE